MKYLKSVKPNGTKGSQKIKRQKKHDMITMIQQSITPCNIETRNNAISLPGFDNSLSCSLCKLKFKGADRKKVTRNGTSLADFMKFAQKQFDQDEGRPGMDIANEIRDGFTRYIENFEDLDFLNNVTSDEIYRHFKYDHAQQKDVKIKEKLMRILLNMLEICVQTSCDKLNGKVFLNKTDANLALNIIDTLIRISTKDKI